jgi:hypothetical protein
MSEARWIPVGEYLPHGKHPEFDNTVRRSDRVVVRVEAAGSHAIAFATCVHYSNGWAPGWGVEGWNGDFKVSHWLPLPPLVESARRGGPAERIYTKPDVEALCELAVAAKGYKPLRGARGDCGTREHCPSCDDCPPQREDSTR